MRKSNPVIESVIEVRFESNVEPTIETLQKPMSKTFDKHLININLIV